MSVLVQGHTVLVDEDDWCRWGHVGWYLIFSPDTDLIYVRGKVLGKPKYLHRVILSPSDDTDVDHRNGNGLDNRRSNLRVCTESQDLGNSKLRKDNTSGYKGVHFFHGRWRARIAINGKRISLGMFSDPWEAAQAYNIAALTQWGEFARLNERLSEPNRDDTTLGCPGPERLRPSLPGRGA